MEWNFNLFIFFESKSIPPLALILCVPPRWGYEFCEQYESFLGMPQIQE